MNKRQLGNNRTPTVLLLCCSVHHGCVQSVPTHFTHYSIRQKRRLCYSFKTLFDYLTILDIASINIVKPLTYSVLYKMLGRAAAKSSCAVSFEHNKMRHQCNLYLLQQELVTVHKLYAVINTTNIFSNKAVRRVQITNQYIMINYLPELLQQ